MKHEFAIYIKDLNFTDHTFKILDEKIYHRLIRVLRASENDQIILFNKEINIVTKVLKVTKKDITFEILQKRENKKNNIKVTVLLGILKPTALEEAIYLCCELGADIIQTVITDKTHQKKFDAKYYERLKKIIISAAEQSKNFCFPELNAPKLLEQVLSDLPKESMKVFFDAYGNKFDQKFIEQIKKSENIFLLFGPEGDLTEQEKDKLKSENFYFCCLTPTILRSQTAVGLGLGIFRSII